MRPNRTIVRSLWTVIIFLALVGLAAGTRRLIVLLWPGDSTSAKNPAAALDAHFADHRALTLIHILPGMLFMILGPLQFIPSLRAKHPRLHRLLGRIFLTASAILGVAGLAMALRPTIGGLDEKAAILSFGTLFLVCLANALRHALRREFSQHREWMIRGFGIGLAVAAVRPVMGVFFASAVAGGHTPDPHAFFGKAFWIGFTLSAIVAELWIRYTRSRAKSEQVLSATHFADDLG
jgi:uncharacterized membrane protein